MQTAVSSLLRVTQSLTVELLGLFPIQPAGFGQHDCGLTVRYSSQNDSTNWVSQTSFLTCKPDILTFRAFSFLASFSRSISTRIREVASTTLFKDDSSAPVWFGSAAEADCNSYDYCTGTARCTHGRLTVPVRHVQSYMYNRTGTVQTS